ncbi:MAG TPA: hypothetical protein VGL44_04940 [Gaiellales bacterium]
MSSPRPLLVLLLAGLAVFAAACGGSSGGSSTSTVTVTTTVSTPATSTSTTGGGTTGGGTTAASGAQNLVATAAIKTQLLDAGAALHKLSPSDYTGLRKGETYYAYDADTKIYWAGTQLVASKKSLQAQVGDQDDGAYLVFKRTGTGAWKGFETGASGEGAICSVKVPAAVLAVWGWQTAACHPRNF